MTPAELERIRERDSKSPQSAMLLGIMAALEGSDGVGAAKMDRRALLVAYDDLARQLQEATQPAGEPKP